MANDGRRVAHPASAATGRRARPRLPAFARLARTHGAAAAGDGAVAVALAGSLFFSLDYDAARWQVVLYLVLTLAPFAVVAPLIGPAIDRIRGGARWILIGTCGVRAVVALLMIGHLDSLLLFPEAFLMLVMGKGYQVAKSAYLPTVVASDEALVVSNSRLAVLSAVSGAVGAAPAAVLSFVGGPAWAVAVALAWFVAATVLATRVPATPVRPSGAPSERERLELSSAGIRLAASAMGLLRGSVGFLTLGIAFELRARSAPPVEFALVLGPLGLGAICGAALAPQVRRRLSEEWMLGGALAVTAGVGLAGAAVGGLVGAALMAAGVAVVSASAKLAFDSLVQRDAPHADHGRAFAAYEARFQLLWVVGALVGVLLPFPLPVGFLAVAVGALVTGTLFLLGRRALEAGDRPPRLADVVYRVMAENPAGTGRVSARASSGRPRTASPADGTAVGTLARPAVLDTRPGGTPEGTLDPPFDDDPDITLIGPPPDHDPRGGRR
jgi:MFS family permease